MADHDHAFRTALDAGLDPPPPAPDPGIEQALPCPLCGYDLRRLPAGRCPECGHAFEPAALRRERDLQLKFLFEHHGGRPIRCFFRTLFRGWRPKRFWTTLTPAMQIMPRRLAVYGGLVFLLALCAAGSGPLTATLSRTQMMFEARQQAEANYARLRPQEKQLMDRRLGGNYLAYVQSMTPMPTEAAFWKDFPWKATLVSGTPLALFIIAWPAITISTLLIFRQSLRQARIRFGHLARVVIYSGDVFAVTLPILAVVSLLDSRRWLPLERLIRESFYPLDHLFFIVPALNGVLLATILILLLLAGWRMARAYQHYLRFPHATATVFASQVIVWLALVTLGGPLLAFIDPLFRV